MAGIKDSQAVRDFKKKTAAAMAKIHDYKQFEEADGIVKFVLDMGRKLFDKNLDQMPPDQLVRIGGKLSGAFSYLGQKASYARAERDVYEQKSDEVEKELMLSRLASDEKYKVTIARAEVSAEIEELKEFVIQKEAEKNAWENIQEACDKMISFVQSAIKVKENERFNSNRLQNNG